jgi:hypothetical protein
MTLLLRSMSREREKGSDPKAAALSLAIFR